MLNLTYLPPVSFNPRFAILVQPYPICLFLSLANENRPTAARDESEICRYRPIFLKYIGDRCVRRPFDQLRHVQSARSPTRDDGVRLGAARRGRRERFATRGPQGAGRARHRGEHRTRPAGDHVRTGTAVRERATDGRGKTAEDRDARVRGAHGFRSAARAPSKAGVRFRKTVRVQQLRLFEENLQTAKLRRLREHLIVVRLFFSSYYTYIYIAGIYPRDGRTHVVLLYIYIYSLAPKDARIIRIEININSKQMSNKI